MKTTSNLFLAIFFFMGLKSCTFIEDKQPLEAEQDTQMAEATNG